MHGGNRNWAARLTGHSPQAILDFSASINPLGPPCSAIAAIQDHLSDLVHYPDPSYHELRQVLAEEHQLSPDWILPGNGSAELLTWACRELSSLAGTVLLTPTFSDYNRALRAFKALTVNSPLFNPEINVPSSLPTRGEYWDASTVLADLIVLQPRQSYGCLLNNPHNPTGWLFSAQSLIPYLETFALVVVDEAFMDFLPPMQQQSLVDHVEAYPNLVILRSLTKFYSLPGLRLGYAIAHPDRLHRWQQWRDPWPVNSLAVAAGIAAVQDQVFQQQTWDWLAVAQPQLFQDLATLPGLIPYQSAANFFLVRSENSVTQLQQQLLQHHCLLIRDCVSFPELGDRYFRVAVRTDAENQCLLAGLSSVLSQLV
jgi:L-threonine-O-3-phosphate decarboxylase